MHAPIDCITIFYILINTQLVLHTDKKRLKLEMNFPTEKFVVTRIYHLDYARGNQGCVIDVEGDETNKYLDKK